MAQTRMHSDWFKVHEQRQNDEWQKLQPELSKFRESPEELRAKAEENAVQFIEIKGGEWIPPDQSNLLLWGEALARTGRESVRFERWRYPHIYSK